MVVFRMRWLALACACLLVLSACGGETSTEANDSTTTGTPSSADATPASTDASTTSAAATESGSGSLDLVPEGETDILGNPAGQGFVELGGVRYDFILNGACQTIFGAVQASGSDASGADVRVSALIPPEDWETDTVADWDPPFVEIEIESNDWRAEAGSTFFIDGESVELGLDESGVGSFSNDGARVAGTAVFYSEFNFEELETATGSFEFFCPKE